MKQPQLLFSYLICLDWTKTTYRKAFCVYEQQTTTPDKESILCKGYPVESSYNTLSSVEYNASGLVSRQNYGNGDYIGYTYDNLDRLTEKVYNGNSINKAKYLYSSDGSIAQTIDYSANTRTKFVYDLAGRIVSEREYNGVSLSEVSLKAYTDYTYADKTNYLTGVRHFSPLGTQTIGYRYGSIASGEMPDQIYSVTWNGKNAVSYTYDILGRLTDKVIGGGVIPSPLHNIYTYVNVDETRTTSLVSSVQTAAGTYSYTYDALGNITSVSDGTYTNSYVYDSLNQLVRENNQKFGKTYTYAYTNGNITESKEYAYTTGELGTPLSVYNWSYGDGTWSDLLTAWNEGAASTANASSASAFSLQNTAESDETSQSFFKRALQRDSANGNVSRAARTASTTDTTQTIFYDESGNPTEIFGLQFSWNGRTLTSVTVPDDPYVSRVDYGYNMDGQRISKKITAPDGTVTTTEFFYNGEILAGEKTGNRTVVYMYDNSGDIFGFSVNERTYYYVKNAQNDVTAITDSNGTVVVYYYYDAWGYPNYTHYACYGQTLDDVQDNPILYRSYYYDIDVGFYYLNSRYYVPMFCRFLNADDHDVSLVSLESSNYDKNLFAYCDNNPVSRADSSGEIWHIAAGAVIGGGFELANQLLSGKSLSELNWAKIGIATASGGLTAALGPLSGAFVSGLTNVALDAIDGKCGATLMRSFASGAAISLIGSGIGKATEKIGGKIAVKQLSKLSKSKVKSKITNLYPSISGKERNAVKNISYLTRNYKDVGSRLLGKTIPTVFSQTSEGLIGIGINRFNTRCRLW